MLTNKQYNRTKKLTNLNEFAQNSKIGQQS